MDERTAICLNNNISYLESIRSSKSGGLFFFINRKMGTLYHAFLKEADQERKLEYCTEILNRFENGFLFRLRLARQILEEDILLYFRQRGTRRTIDYSKKKQKDYYSVVVIVKNESRYIREFILFNQAVGADRIYIYDNDSTDHLLEVIKPFLESGLVVYRRWEGKNVQTAAYRDAVRRTKKRTKWLAVIDVDEFLFSPQENMIEQLKKYEQYPGVAANWVVFGPNGHRARPEGLVMKNYTTTLTDRDALPNCHIKSIIQPKKVFSVTNPHFAWYRHGRRAVNELGQIVDNRNALVKRCGQAFTSHNHREIFRINHYNTKSLEDLQEKCNRGYADGNPPAKFDDQLQPYHGELLEDLVIQPLAEIVEGRILKL